MTRNVETDQRRMNARSTNNDVVVTRTISHEYQREEIAVARRHANENAHSMGTNGNHWIGSVIGRGLCMEVEVIDYRHKRKIVDSRYFGPVHFLVAVLPRCARDIRRTGSRRRQIKYFMFAKNAAKTYKICDVISES